MRKILVFQHVAHEILGGFDPLLKARGFRVRYINFSRQPDTIPSIERYNGLVVLGGPMGVYEAEQYPHLRVELQAIETALKRDIPILGICLGSQLLAQVLGSPARRHTEKEIGWYDMEFLPEAANDPLFSDFGPREKLFQIHGDTFDIPKSAVHLARTPTCPSQIFRYGQKAYGLQCHLEVDAPMIHRWLKVPVNVKDLEDSGGKFTADKINSDSEVYGPRSRQLCDLAFNRFLDLFKIPPRGEILGSR
jgi:GMP synthase (glutamine-hydrolysing)